MASGIVTRARIARRLSRIGTDELMSSEMANISDYSTKVKQFHEEAAVDRRAVAIGADVESHFYDALIDPSDDFAHVIWQHVAQIKIWFDLLLSGGTVESPKKALIPMQLPWNFVMEMISDRTKEITFINNLELFYFEKFYLTDDILEKYPEIKYSAIDQSDICNGAMLNEYDLVRATGFNVHMTSNSLLSGLMDSVKVGGTFILSDASDYGMIYLGPENEITSPFWDYGKYITSREDFISYHLPYDVGLVVAKKTA